MSSCGTGRGRVMLFPVSVMLLRTNESGAGMYFINFGVSFFVCGNWREFKTAILPRGMRNEQVRAHPWSRGCGTAHCFPLRTM